MKIELEEEERRELQSVLETQLKSLRNELAHTDDRSYRQTVRQTLDRLEGVARKLASGPMIGSKAS